MTENKTSKMNLEQERKIAELQERGEPTGKPLLCGQGSTELRGSGELSRHCQKQPCIR